MKIQLYKAKRKLDDMEIGGVFLHARDTGQNHIDSYHIIRPNGVQMAHYTNEIDIETLEFDGFEEIDKIAPTTYSLSELGSSIREKTFLLTRSLDINL